MRASRARYRVVSLATTLAMVTAERHVHPELDDFYFCIT
jgi:hypothetical protein